MEPHRGRSPFAAVVGNPFRIVRLFHAFLSCSAVRRDGRDLHLRGTVHCRGGARQLVRVAISSREIRRHRNQDSGEFLCPVKRSPSASLPASMSTADGWSKAYSSCNCATPAIPPSWPRPTVQPELTKS